MKKLFVTLLMLFISYLGLGQFTGTKLTNFQYIGAVKVDSFLFIASNDTTKFAAPKYPGAIIFRQQPGDTGHYASNGLIWVKISSGQTPNIYNSDGDLTGNRTLNGRGNNLYLDSLGNFRVLGSGSMILQHLDTKAGLGADGTGGIQLVGGNYAGTGSGGVLIDPGMPNSDIRLNTSRANGTGVIVSGLPNSTSEDSVLTTGTDGKLKLVKPKALDSLRYDPATAAFIARYTTGGELTVQTGFLDSLFHRYTKYQSDSIFYSKDSSNKKFSNKLNVISDGNAVITTADTLFALGDSYTVGVGTSIPQRSYINLLTNKLGMVLQNAGVSGTGVFRATRNAFQNLQQTNSNRVVTMLAGFNDTWKGEGGFKTRTKIFWGVRSVIMNNFLKTAVPASSGSFVGTWGTVNTDTLSGKSFFLGGTGRSSASSADTATFTFTGPNVVIGTFATDGIIKTAPPFQVVVDTSYKGTFTMDGTTDGISDGTYSNVYMPGQVIIQDLGPGNHTVRIIPGSAAGTGGKTFILDFVGTLNVPDSVQPVIIGQIPKLNSAGYYELDTSYGKHISDATMTAVDSIIKSAITTTFMGYPVAFAPLSNYCDPAVDNIFDNVHYNDLGHQHIADAFASVIKKIKTPLYSYVSPSNNLQTVMTNGAFTSSTLAVRGFNNTPTSGSGMELSYNSTFDGGTSFMFSYNRSAPGYIPLRLRGSKIVFDEGNVGVGKSDGASIPTSTFVSGGSIAMQDTATASIITAGNHTVIRITNSSHSVTLPTASTCRGRIYEILNETAGGVTISSVIDFATGAGSTSIPTKTYWRIYSDGTNWRLLSRSN